MIGSVIVPAIAAKSGANTTIGATDWILTVLLGLIAVWVLYQLIQIVMAAIDLMTRAEDSHEK